MTYAEAHAAWLATQTATHEQNAIRRTAALSLGMQDGCRDGGCVVVLTIGQHTNGGCKCWHTWDRRGPGARKKAILDIALATQDAQGKLTA